MLITVVLIILLLLNAYKTSFFFIELILTEFNTLLIDNYVSYMYKLQIVV